MAPRFQSTLPWWERLPYATKLTALELVSIHAPVVGATYLRKLRNNNKSVSIHAPVVGATKLPATFLADLLVSIHAPVVGATSLSGISSPISVCFNPRSRGGSDYHLQSYHLVQAVSIHAPVVGATSAQVCTQRHTHCFNPRSRGGSDSMILRAKDA